MDTDQALLERITQTTGLSEATVRELLGPEPPPEAQLEDSLVTTHRLLHPPTQLLSFVPPRARRRSRSEG